jgi:CelD/BcsL family acetyltransferase involved in cellulose biosynthesis
MRIIKLTADELTAEHWAGWAHIVRENADLNSPLFAPQLVQRVAALRNGIEIAVLEEDGQPVGYLPYRRTNRGHAEPVAGTLSSLQGLVACANVCLDPRQLLCACDLRCLHFTDWLAAQTEFFGVHRVAHEFPYIDLARGFDAYRQEQRRAGSDELEDTLRKARKIQREVGPLRFVSGCRDSNVLRVLLQWKCQQLADRRVVNPLAVAWQQQLLANLLHVQTPNFSGELCALFVGEKLLAGTMGVRSATVLNGWVTAFEPGFRKYSPGLLLITQLAQHAASMGIQRIDMGRGPEAYKRSFQSGALRVAQGFVSRRGLRSALRGAYWRAREWARHSAVGGPARQLVQRWRYAVERNA